MATLPTDIRAQANGLGQFTQRSETELINDAVRAYIVGSGKPPTVLIGDSLVALHNSSVAPIAVSGDGTTLTLTFSAATNMMAGNPVYLGQLGAAYDGKKTVLTINAAKTIITVASSYVGTTFPGTFQVKDLRVVFERGHTLGLAVYKNPIHIAANCAAVGRRTDETFAMIANDNIDSLYKPRIVIDNSGINDIIQLFGGTYATGTANAIAYKKMIAASISAMGAVPVFFTLSPLASGHAQYAAATPYIVQFNEWLRANAISMGAIIIDVWKLMVDPLNANKGCALAIMISTDFLHWSKIGAYTVWKEVGRVLSLSFPMAQGVDPLPCSNADCYGYTVLSNNIWDYGPWINTNGGSVASGTVTNNGIPTGFRVTNSGGATVTTSIAVRTVANDGDTDSYNLQLVIRPSASTDIVTIDTAAIGFSARSSIGNSHSERCSLRINGLTGVAHTLSGLDFQTTEAVDGVNYFPGFYSSPVPALGTQLVPEDINIPFDVELHTIAGTALTTFITKWVLYFSGAMGTDITVNLGRVGFYKRLP